MGSYLEAVWKCRYFWMSLVKMDLRNRYRGSVIGVGWTLLQPLAMTIILSLVFSKLLNQPFQTYAPRLLGGLACWQFLVKVTLQGCQSFFMSQAYIRAQPMPVAIYPLRTALGETFHFLISLIVVFSLAAFMRVGDINLLALPSLLPTVVLLFILAWSLAVIAGFANVYFQDTPHVLEILFQLWFYATPIIYPEDLLVRNGLGWLVRVNPVVPLLRLIRAPIMEGTRPGLQMYAIATAIVAVAFAFAVLLLHRLQRKLIFHL